MDNTDADFVRALADVQLQLLTGSATVPEIITYASLSPQRPSRSVRRRTRGPQIRTNAQQAASPERDPLFQGFDAEDSPSDAAHYAAYPVQQSQTADNEPDLGLLCDLEELMRGAYFPEELPDPDQSAASTAWQKRTEETQKAWYRARHALCHGMVILEEVPGEPMPCSRCSIAYALVRCLDCEHGQPSLLCGNCDRQQHPSAHFHRRHKFSNGFYEALAAEDEYGDDGVLTKTSKYLDCKPRQCNKCLQPGLWSDGVAIMAPTGRLLYILHGVHNFRKAVFTCQHPECGHKQVQEPLDFLQIGAWPGSVHPEQYAAVIDQRCLEDWHLTKSHLPSSSLQGFLAALSEKSWAYGGEGIGINQTLFSRSFSEYILAKHSLRLHYEGIDDMECPADYGSMHSLHVDTNAKLIVWDRGHESWRTANHDGRVFRSSTVCQEHIAVLDRATGSGYGGDATCRGIWKAAGDKKSRHDKMEVTGRCFGTCRHCMVAGAVNLWRSGERYGYSHFLLTDLLYELQPLLVHQDIACKHKGWRQRVQSAVLASEDPDIQASAAFQRIQQTEAQAGTSADVLPDAHALLHSWPCQWLFGAARVEGAAAGTGENSEQVFAYLHRRAPTTKNMSVSGSEDDLTETSLFWNAQRRERLSKQLRDRLVLMEKRLPVLKREFRQECQALLGKDGLAAEAEIRILKAQLDIIAEGQLSRGRHSSGKAVEFFKLYQRFLDAKRLRTFSETSLAQRLVAAEDGDLSTIHSIAQALTAGIEDMRSKLPGLREEAARELRLGLDESSDSSVAAAAFQVVAEQCILLQQDNLEALAATVRKHKYKLLNVAATHKEKVRYNQKLEEDGKLIREAVKHYNELLPFGQTDGRPDASAEDIRNASFPWADESVAGPTGAPQGQLVRRLGVYKALHLCQLHNKVRRTREEIELLAREMLQYMQYFCGKQAIEESLEKLHHARASAGPSPHLASLQATERYRLTTEDAAQDLNFLGGCMALLCKGRAHHARLAQAGTRWFAHLVRATDRASLSVAHETDHLVVSEGTD